MSSNDVGMNDRDTQYTGTCPACGRSVARVLRRPAGQQLPVDTIYVRCAECRKIAVCEKGEQTLSVNNVEIDHRGNER